MKGVNFSFISILSLFVRHGQVEYAIEAINNAGTCVGILAKDGIVMASERRITSGLLAPAKVSMLISLAILVVVRSLAGLTSRTFEPSSIIDLGKDIPTLLSCIMQCRRFDGGCQYTH
jgi:hypothetical protein